MTNIEPSTEDFKCYLGRIKVSRSQNKIGKIMYVKSIITEILVQCRK